MRVLFITLGVFLLDQVSKLAVRGFSVPSVGLDIHGMEYGQSIPLIGTWLNLTFIENPNMAFGLEIGGKTFLTVFAVVASIAVVLYLYKHRSASLGLRLALALILAGALGNLVDRIFYGVLYGYAPFFEGHVVDFIDFDLFLVHIGHGAFKFWPIFNIADAAVSIGVVLIVWFGGVKKTSESAITNDIPQLVQSQGATESPRASTD